MPAGRLPATVTSPQRPECSGIPAVCLCASLVTDDRVCTRHPHRSGQPYKKRGPDIPGPVSQSPEGGALTTGGVPRAGHAVVTRNGGAMIVPRTCLMTHANSGLFSAIVPRKSTRPRRTIQRDGFTDSAFRRLTASRQSVDNRQSCDLIAQRSGNSGVISVDCR